MVASPALQYDNKIVETPQSLQRILGISDFWQETLLQSVSSVLAAQADCHPLPLYLREDRHLYSEYRQNSVK